MGYQSGHNNLRRLHKNKLKINMKTIFVLLLVFAFGVSQAQVIVNGGTDALTGKRIKVHLNQAVVNAEGYWEYINYTVRYYETDNTTEVVPAGTDLQKRAVEKIEQGFSLVDRYIDSSTKLFIASDSDNPNKILLSQYLLTKAINTFDGVAGGDNSFKFHDRYFKEIITILRLNNKIP